MKSHLLPPPPSYPNHIFSFHFFSWVHSFLLYFLGPLLEPQLRQCSTGLEQLGMIFLGPSRCLVQTDKIQTCFPLDFSVEGLGFQFPLPVMVCVFKLQYKREIHSSHLHWLLMQGAKQSGAKERVIREKAQGHMTVRQSPACLSRAVQTLGGCDFLGY